MTGQASGISKERLAYLLALSKAQDKQSPLAEELNQPNRTIKDDIADSLKENIPEAGQLDSSNLGEHSKDREETFADKLKRLRESRRENSSGTSLAQESTEIRLGTETASGEKNLGTGLEPVLPPGTPEESESICSDRISDEGELSTPEAGVSNSNGSDEISNQLLQKGREDDEDGVSGVPAIGTTTDKYGNEITYNSKQAEFIRIASSGESCVLIGAAGTGKTTCQKGVVGSLNESGFLGKLESQGHKHLISDTPGIVICAYTRRAVANIRRNMPIEFQSNCITIHKLLEYEPVYFTVIDEETGREVNKMAFEPARNALNPLPPSIKSIVFEEGSMLGIDLHKEVSDASPHNPQQIFLGDIQQLPPVFGPAILGFKLLELPVVELTEVYRQALESPIIRLAHRVLSGNPIPAKEYPEWNFPGKLTIKPWKKKIKELDGLNTIGLMFCGNKHVQSDPEKQATGLEEAGYYDPEEDIILIPFNKSFGTDELNKKIAHYLARKRKAKTFQVVAGFNKHYFSSGDRVLFDKEDAIIEKIESNPIYSGAKAIEASETLDYWGFDPVVHTSGHSLSDDAVDFLLNQVASTSSEDRVNSASHRITLRMSDYDKTITLDKAGDINNLSLGYCLTVHKSQGSEWRKVFFIMHQSHATMLQRELLYTGITRAREELFIVCEPETFTNGIKSQRVKGDTLAEKAEYFKGRKSEFNERIG